MNTCTGLGKLLYGIWNSKGAESNKCFQVSVFYLHSHSGTSSTSSLEDEYFDPEEGQSFELQVALTWLINSSGENPQNKRAGVIPLMFCAMSPTHPSSWPCPVLCAMAQCHQTLPHPCLPGASRSCLCAQCHSWALGNRRKAAGCAGSQASTPWCSLIEHRATSCVGLSIPLGGGKGQGTVALSSRDGKSP